MIGIDGIDGTFRHTGPAIDTYIGIDVQLLYAFELRLVRRGADAVDRAYPDAGSRFFFTASFNDYVCHAITNLFVVATLTGNG